MRAVVLVLVLLLSSCATHHVSSDCAECVAGVKKTVTELGLPYNDAFLWKNQQAIITVLKEKGLVDEAGQNSPSDN